MSIPHLIHLAVEDEVPQLLPTDPMHAVNEDEGGEDPPRVAHLMR